MHPVTQLPVFFILFQLFQESEKRQREKIQERKLDEREKSARIRCPQCHWQPKAVSRWFCGPCADPENFFGGCGSWWNTFQTRGRCPGCGHQWRWTACLRCTKWSLHEDWYEQNERYTAR
jgi:hypothetical protein